MTETKTRSPERIEFLNYLLSCAIEGGINYWAMLDEYSWENVEERRAEIVEIGADGMEPDDEGVVEVEQRSIFGIHTLYGLPHEIDLDVIARGINAISRREVRFHNPGYDGDSNTRLGLLNRTNGEDDRLGDYDAWDADAIVQVGLFGEIRYS